MSRYQRYTNTQEKKPNYIELNYITIDKESLIVIQEYTYYIYIYKYLMYNLYVHQFLANLSLLFVFFSI